MCSIKTKVSKFDNSKSPRGEACSLSLIFNDKRENFYDGGYSKRVGILVIAGRVDNQLFYWLH